MWECGNGLDRIGGIVFFRMRKKVVGMGKWFFGLWNYVFVLVGGWMGR